MIFTADPYRVLDHVSLQLTTQSDLAGSHLSSRRGWTQPEDGAAIHPRSPSRSRLEKPDSRSEIFLSPLFVSSHITRWISSTRYLEGSWTFDCTDFTGRIPGNAASEKYSAATTNRIQKDQDPSGTVPSIHCTFLAPLLVSCYECINRWGVKGERGRGVALHSKASTYARCGLATFFTRLKSRLPVNAQTGMALIPIESRFLRKSR
ncbi:hypothetical protein CPAR01_12234 [Colletotrichum paranaense]|uniref:Uncharacterized protein n=1 Tax=Colletotrichum paranaense TaxID=1914294 RepID=A0ABQ9S9D8_9PEZI|nr:uncharacterized protein CPAR01_12234 [Colletotrichum paranaense]KAK1529922.1 hypothetical protein CPAR01_12234 [Colletotrichum paranaense]